MINVIGLGYIGLPTALMFAKSNENKVVGSDYKQDLVDSLNKGQLTFEEHGLKELFETAVDNGIKFETKYVNAEVYIISVPTPYIKKTKKLDATFVINAVKEVLRICKTGTIVVIESTISPGTIDKYIRPIIKDEGYIIGKDIHIAHAPERIIPGNMIYELTNNSRTIGVDSAVIGDKLKKIYSSFCKGEIVITDIKSAEMTKVVENTYRDINIAFANELAKICRSDGMDVYEIIRIANKHPRVNILQPGPGVGGHCISVDPWFLVGDYPDLAKIIGQARTVNDSMPEYVLNRLLDIMNENGIDDFAKVGIYGITYKENIDDTRESPTLQLMDKLYETNKKMAESIIVYDPFVTDRLFKSQVFDFLKFIEDVDLLLIMVNHKEIISNMSKIKDKIIFDTKNCCDLEKAYKL